MTLILAECTLEIKTTIQIKKKSLKIDEHHGNADAKEKHAVNFRIMTE